MSGRRIDLSATQVTASMLAAVTGAVAASYLGVAGTVVGTAVMSVASTAAAAVYKHYIGRSRERLRAAREAAARSAPLLAHHRAARPGHDMSQAATGTDLSRGERGVHSATRPARTPAPDAEETQVLPAVGYGPRRWDDADRANGLADGATQIVRRPDPGDSGGRRDRAGGSAGAGAPGDAGARDDRGPGAGDAGPDAPRDARWRRPLVLAGIALGVFVLAMAGITAFEAVVGKPLDAVVGSGHGSGTTIGSIVGGSAGHTAPRHTGPARPSQNRSPSPTSPASTSGPAPTPNPTPTPTPSPSPSPGASPSPSPATSAGAPASSGQTGSPLAHGARPSRSPAGG